MLAGYFAANGLALLACALACTTAAGQPSERLQKLNDGFLQNLSTLGPDRAVLVESIRRGWKETYESQAPQSFVPDALAVLYPDFRRAMEAFDAQQPEKVIAILEPLRSSDDRYLAANAAYFHVRALVDAGRLEEAERAAQSVIERPEIELQTPFAPQLWFIRAFCESRNLRYEAAANSLGEVKSRFADAPEPVQIGARQLGMELERREAGTLEEVSSVMGYAADRLRVEDTADPVRERQQQAIDLLDKLIEQAQQQEQQQQQQGRSGGRGQQPSNPQEQPAQPREDSTAPAGSGDIGELHAGAKANPGEMWGKMPPAEREKILQSIRERYPSRYRQLVEQYYRSLAEEKK